MNPVDQDDFCEAIKAIFNAPKETQPDFSKDMRLNSNSQNISSKETNDEDQIDHMLFSDSDDEWHVQPSISNPESVVELRSEAHYNCVMSQAAQSSIEHTNSAGPNGFRFEEL